MPKKTEKKPLKRSANIPGICADAKLLNCTRIHLNLVLRGHRKSKSLLSRYNALRAERGQSPIIPPDRSASVPTLSEILARCDAVLEAINRQEEALAAMQRKLAMLIHQTQKTKGN